jgi:hypothetical protein
MKYTISITVAVLIFIIGGTAFAAPSIKALIRAEKPWGIVADIRQETKVYRLVDTENKNVCYFAYGPANALPQMSCVHSD